MFDSIFFDGSLQDYVQQNTHDPWIGTPFEGYVHISPKQKGEFGEKFVTKYFELLGHTVKRAKTSTAGHDRIISGINVEIKFSLANRCKVKNTWTIQKDKFMINHLKKGKDWERVVFFGINPIEEESRLLWYDKKDFLQHVDKDGCPIIKQQGGKTEDNDDYICTDIVSLLNCDWVKSLDQWSTSTTGTRIPS